MVKDKAKKSKVAEIVDTDQYEIDNIVGNSIEGYTILYETRWLGYSEEYDTHESEWRMTCDERLLTFAKSKVICETYVDNISTILVDLEDVENDKEVILNILDPLSIIAQTTVQCGSVKFVDVDTIGSKILFLKYIRDCEQTHLCNSALIPSEEEIEKSSKRYEKELKSRFIIFKEHPLVKITYPFERQKFFYSPPPLRNLLFEPVTDEMFENGENMEHLFVTGSKDFGFNKTRPFLHKSCVAPKPIDNDPKYFDHLRQNRGEQFYKGMDRINYSKDPRFNINLELTQEVGYGWVLFAAQDVPEETPLLMMTGVISHWETAHESLVKSGERVAFSSFVLIPGTGMCLDRRMYHEFSKFIPHSCNPTCSVRLVDSGNEYPDLVVYSIVDINEGNEHMITLDYYDGFVAEVKNYFRRRPHPDGKIFYLYEKNIDFVHCQCQSYNCREVLYVDMSKKATDKTARKTEKLANLDESFQFPGLAVAEADRIWEIKDGQFVEQ